MKWKHQPTIEFICHQDMTKNEFVFQFKMLPEDFSINDAILPED